MKAAGSCGCFHRLASTNPLFSWHNGRKLQTFPFCCSLIKASSSLLRHKLAQALRAWDPTRLCPCRWGGQWVAVQPGSRNPPLQGLLPGRWGVIQRPCPGGFHVQGAGQWLVAEGSGANWCKTPKKCLLRAAWFRRVPWLLQRGFCWGRPR